MSPVLLVPPPPPDTWLNVVTGFGAAAGFLAVAGGAVVAFLYGRRASVEISATVHATPEGFVLSTRPVVKAVGIFPVKFSDDGGVTVRLAEVFVDEEGALTEEEIGLHGGAFGQQYVDPGEQLSTTVSFGPIKAPPTVIGWQAYLGIGAKTRLGRRVRTSYWSDQIFVPRPASNPGDIVP